MAAVLTRNSCSASCVVRTAEVYAVGLRIVGVDAIERHRLLVGACAGDHAVAWVFLITAGFCRHPRDEDGTGLQAEQLHHVLGLDRQAADLIARDALPRWHPTG